jgi:hypothetical protein
VTFTEVQALMFCILLFSFLMAWVESKGAWRWGTLIGLSVPISIFVGLAINFEFADTRPNTSPGLICCFKGRLLSVNRV